MLKRCTPLDLANKPPECEDKDKCSLKSSNMSVNFGSVWKKILSAECFEKSSEQAFIFGLILSEKINTMYDKFHMSLLKR